MSDIHIFKSSPDAVEVAAGEICSPRAMRAM
jgi:hypothetical protein